MGEHSSTPVIRGDVCIVGAGIAGLNALFVAGQYLSRDQKVILVDRRERSGGMWVDTYDYVRLHQPHPMFTAGNLKWTLGKEPAYLANKGEVLDHFEHCVNTIRQRVQVDERYGWDLEGHEEVDNLVRVTCRAADGETHVIEVQRLIKAFGFEINPNEPLALSSSHVRSVSPDFCDVRGGEMRDSDAPVWVVGGGKTGMDTAHALVTEYPGREVNLIAGSGTVFTNRDRAFPTGARRWWSGGSLNALFVESARRFDGTNEAAVRDWYRETHGLCLTPQAGNFLFGLLSEAENRTIAAGLNEILMDHLVDVVDRDGGAEIVLRSGDTRPVESGSWIVNCTGYFLPRHYPYEPYTSASGNVLSIQAGSWVASFSHTQAYFLTHLMFLGKLAEVPLYALDLDALRGRSTVAWSVAFGSLAMYNAGLLIDALPLRVIRDNGLDLDRWFPLPRRLLWTPGFLRALKRDRGGHLRALETLRQRFDLRGGPVVDVRRTTSGSPRSSRWIPRRAGLRRRCG